MGIRNCAPSNALDDNTPSHFYYTYIYHSSSVSVCAWACLPWRLGLRNIALLVRVLYL